MPLTKEEERELAELEAQEANLQKQNKQPEASNISKTESLARGAAQGATLGFGDELSSGLELGIGKLTGNEAYKDISYSDLKKESQVLDKAAKVANPKSYFAGDLLGSISTTAPLTAGVSALASKGGGLLSRLSLSAAQGGTESAARAVGEGKDPTKAAIVGTAVGAAGQAGAEVIKGLSTALKSIGSELSNWADEVGVKIIGFSPTTLRKVRGGPSLDPLKRVKEVSRELIDADLLSKSQSLPKLHKNVASMQKALGEELQSVYKNADQLAPEGLFSKGEILSGAEKAYRASTEFPKVRDISTIKNQLKQLMESLPDDKKIGADKLWKMTREIESLTGKWNKASNPSFASRADLMNGAAEWMRGHLKETIGSLDPNLGDLLNKTAPLYSKLSLAEKALANRVISSVSKNISISKKSFYEAIIESTVGSPRLSGPYLGLLEKVSKLTSNMGQAGNDIAGLFKAMTMAYAGTEKGSE